MKYHVSEGNGQTHTFDTAKALQAWIKKSGYVFEPNVKLHGLVSALKDQGHVFAYGKTWALAVVTFAEGD